MTFDELSAAIETAKIAHAWCAAAHEALRRYVERVVIPLTVED